MKGRLWRLPACDGVTLARFSVRVDWCRETDHNDVIETLLVD